MYCIDPLMTIQLTTIAVVNYILERNERWPARNLVPNSSKWAGGGLMTAVRTWGKESYLHPVSQARLFEAQRVLRVPQKVGTCVRIKDTPMDGNSPCYLQDNVNILPLTLTLKCPFGIQGYSINSQVKKNETEKKPHLCSHLHHF